MYKRSCRILSCWRNRECLIIKMHLTDENFKREIENSPKPVLVDFWASWCMPCSALSPILERIAVELEDKIIFVKANVDEIPLTAQEFQIDKIPTVILFSGGKPINGFIGVKPEEEIQKWIEENLRDNSKEVEKAIEQLRVGLANSLSRFSAQGGLLAYARAPARDPLSARGRSARGGKA